MTEKEKDRVKETKEKQQEMMDKMSFDTSDVETYKPKAEDKEKK